VKNANDTTNTAKAFDERHAADPAGPSTTIAALLRSYGGEEAGFVVNSKLEGKRE
jgi:hypothetical protein